MLHSSCFIYKINMWFLLLLAVIINIWVCFQWHPISFCRRLFIHVFKRRSWRTYIYSFVIILLRNHQKHFTASFYWTCLIWNHSSIYWLLLRLFLVYFLFYYIMNICFLLNILRRIWFITLRICSWCHPSLLWLLIIKKLIWIILNRMFHWEFSYWG